MLDRVHSGALSPGTCVGRYEVESFLGAGGMGEVYVARDTTLGRRIALKVLPSGCERDRIARFIREAQASSALNHPAIVSMHDAGSADGIQFLAMELIDGEPLSSWMRSHRNARRTTELMAQVADGLAAAHDAGIVHRDLKPANIMIGRDGHAKIVDFGVAKLTERTTGPADATDMKTAEGTRVGTVAYMSPEQIEGHHVDSRSDIFSFGTVLCELLTGKHPFAEESQADTIHNIARREPALETIPGRQRRIVARCLAKEPGERYQSMKDVAHDLRDALAESSPTAGSRRRLAAWLLLAGALAVLLAALLLIGRLHPPVATATRQPSMQRMTNSGWVLSAAISPDGKFVVYDERQHGLSSLWVKQVVTGATKQLTAASPAAYPVIKISPDSDYVYYTMWIPGAPLLNADIYQLPILGGEPRKIVSKLFRLDFAISPDGRKLAFRRENAALTVVDIDSGVERTLLSKATVHPAWLPDGNSISFIGKVASDWFLEEILLSTGAQRLIRRMPWTWGQGEAWLPDGSGMVLSTADRTGAPQIWLLPRNGTSPTRLTTDISSYDSPTPTADGRSFATVRGEGSPSITILAVDDDGGTRVVASGLGDYFGVAGARSRSRFFWGETIRWIDSERILYTGLSDGVQTFFVIPRSGGQPQRIIRGMEVCDPAMSPDGKRLVFAAWRAKTADDVWVSNIDGTNARKVTTGATGARPEFTNDGRFISYVSQNAIWRIPAEGGKAERLNVALDSEHVAMSSDGRWLMFRADSDSQRTHLVPLPAGGPPRVFNVPQTPSYSYMRFHPSGRAFGYVDWSGEVANIWLQDIDGGRPRQITHFDHDRGDIYAFDWSPDGKWLAVLYGEPRTDVVIIRDFR
jgi:Tol biopolymer transport system component/predicted Ser/Thr protein kinase